MLSNTHMTNRDFMLQWLEFYKLDLKNKEIKYLQTDKARKSDK